MLHQLLIVPLIGIFLLIIIPASTVKPVSLATSTFNFFCGILLFLNFDSKISDYQFTSTIDSISFCHLYLGVDGISIYFILLTTILIPICILSNWNNIIMHQKSYFISFLFLEILLIAVFSVLDLVLFYIFFESVLIPLFIIIGTWGSGDQRVRAAFLLFLYTLLGSLFILIAILIIFNQLGSTDFSIISISEISLESQKYIFLGFFISIAIKTPLYPFYTWLTFAHVDAPVAGSIILAGAILKLALYGFLRIILVFIPDATNYYYPLIQTSAIISIIFASTVTIRQQDLKKFVAYSSIAHAATIILGTFSNSIQGMQGAIILGLSHGIVSPAIFFLLGGVIYDRFHTRTIKYFRGLAVYIPIFAFFFVIFSFSNAAVPISGNFIGELLSIMGIFQQNPFISFIACTAVVLSAGYSVWNINRLIFGNFSRYLLFFIDINKREFFIFIPISFFTLILGIHSNFILMDIQYGVSTLINLYLNSFYPFILLSFYPIKHLRYKEPLPCRKFY